MGYSQHQLQRNGSLPLLGTPARCGTHVQQIDRLQVLPELGDPLLTNGLGDDPRVFMGASVLSKVLFFVYPSADGSLRTKLFQTFVSLIQRGR